MTTDPPGKPNYLRAALTGLVAGAADVDPTTVATMSVIGATTVFGLSWLTLLVFPVLAVIQAIGARVGVMTRCDLQGCVSQRYGRLPRWILLGSVLAVTLITIAADLEGGAAALGLLFGKSWRPFVAPLGAAVVCMLVVGTYDEVVGVLKYLLLALFAYVASAFLAHADWRAVARSTLVPRLHMTGDWTGGALALLGTTLTSYVYIWQTIEESEERPPFEWVRAKEFGATVGILFGVVLFWFILVSTGATLGVNHRKVETAQQAAQALRPVAGAAASYIFGVGLLASAVVALPVLIATCAYVVGSDLDWERGLSRPVRGAPRFYGVLAMALALGVGVAQTGVSPIRLLFVAGIVGGFGTPIGMVFLLLIASDREMMRGQPVPGPLQAGGWAVTLLVAAASTVYVIQPLVAGR